MAATSDSAKEFAAVGDLIPVDCVGNNCAGELKVEDILLGGACKVQLVAEEIPEGLQLVQISGVLSAPKEILDDTGAEIGARPEGPEVWDSEQFKSTGEWGGGCDIPQGYEQWNVVPAKTGEKVRIYGSFLISDDAQVLGIANSRFDLRELEEVMANTTAFDAPSPSSVEEQPTPQQDAPVQEQPVEPPAPAQQEEPVVGYTEAPGQVEPQVMDKQIASCGDPSIHETGTTFFTDGTSGWTANCAAQMM